MTTPSGTISLNDMHVEAGGTSGTTCSFDDRDIRQLGYYYSPGTAKTFLQMRSKTRGYHNLVGTAGGASYTLPPSPVSSGSVSYARGVGSVILFGQLGTWAGSDTVYESAFTATAGHDSYITVYLSSSSTDGVNFSGGQMVLQSGTASNSGWSYMQINSTYYYRTSSTYSAFGNGGQWVWPGNNHPNYAPFPNAGSTFNFYAR
tara:strand:- start:767 stop:1375 length:609 start_codon:yes stop_codon:yes gene_type:complete